MSTFSLILKEIRHRKINFVLSLLAVLTAVSLFVAFVTTGSQGEPTSALVRRDEYRRILERGIFAADNA